MLLLACAQNEPQFCNGDPSFCARSLPELTLPATHNSMSNADAGWYFPDQQHGLKQQLEDGIRGMLLDTYDNEGELSFCHAYCSLGSQPMSEGLGIVQDFMEENPNEVLVFILQDNITPEQTATAFEDAGLSPYLFTPPTDNVWPTLAEMIAADTRLLVTAESADPPDGWYRNAWDLFFDSPYTFKSVDEMNCELNRGDPANPLFLVNHWVADPMPSPEQADISNTAEVLEDRMAECQALWGRNPNLLAVDFYDRGALFDVTRHLNGL